MIDQTLLTARDFIGVRASLIVTLGNNAARALVLTRIFWRASELNTDAHENDGFWWWRTTYSRLAEETGLTEQQVRPVVKWLLEKGHIETREFRFNGITDRTLSFRVVTSMLDSTDGLLDRTDGVLISTDQSMLNSTDLPSIKKEEELVSSRFDEFWSVYPRRIAKATAMKAWTAAMKRAKAEDIISAAGRYAATVVDSEERFIAHPSTWLNGDRWADFQEPEPEVHRSPTYGMNAEQRAAYNAAEIEKERKRAEDLSRYGYPGRGDQ